jgi:hypothetical protein
MCSIPTLRLASAAQLLVEIDPVAFLEVRRRPSIHPVIRECS